MIRAADLTAYDAVILDFDGPMCSVFAGYPATTIADDLRSVLVDQGWPAQLLPTEGDPHRLIIDIYERSPADHPLVEARLAAAELLAVETATETTGLPELLDHLGTHNVPVAVASNNNAAAIRRWLGRQGYPIALVAGRDEIDPHRMKPAPDVLLRVLNALGVAAGSAVFVGDAVSDAQAAAAAGTEFVALANKPHKIELFAQLGCPTIVTGLSALVPTHERPNPVADHS